MTVRRILLPLALLALCAPLAAQNGPPQAPPGNAENGRRAYMETGCYACHGTVGQGGAWQGPKLAPQPLVWPLFLNQLRHPRAAMPTYSADVLSDAEVADIYAWLGSLPAGPGAESIRILQP